MHVTCCFVVFVDVSHWSSSICKLPGSRAHTVLLILIKVLCWGPTDASTNIEPCPSLSTGVPQPERALLVTLPAFPDSEMPPC